jgi:transcriptional regulator GlxA family with amidase domain
MHSKLQRVSGWEKLAREANFRPAVMAALCPISLRQMERYFLTHFHKSPRRWVKELRCRLARQLIERGYSSKAVVEDLHFADHAHLCHEFKQVYGVAPQDVGPMFR